MKLRLIVPLLLLTMAVAIPQPARAQKAPPDSPLVTAQLELVRAQIETEKTRMAYYVITAPRVVPFLKKLVSDPADSIGALGAVLGMMVAFFVLMGNRHATRCYRRDVQFYEALRRFGDTGTSLMRASAAGLLAQMAKAREGRSYPYLDTAVDQLVAGHRLEENDAVRDAMTGALKQLILVDPIRVRTKLSAAGIKLPDA